jgi:carbonic anhydrase
MVPLDRLLTGVRKFRREVYPSQKEMYEQVMREPQRPHTLVVTCADSRVDLETLTQSSPGEIFVSRNIGNLVPAYGQMPGGISAVIEYAVTALEVSQVVICGHEDCGAMKGLLQPDTVAKMPLVRSWLMNAEAALSVVEARNPGGARGELLNQLIEANVVLQMSHLRTHPLVAGRLAMGTLAISGWVYDIAGGSVRVHDERLGRFVEQGLD